jgi:general secretion pathway protein G
MDSARPASAPQPAARGFTLIELMIVVAILAVLAAGAVPLGQLAVQRTREQDLRLGLRQIRTAIDAYKKAADEGRVERKADETGYPRRLADLANGMPDIKTPDRRLIRFLRRIPRDPFAPAELSAEETWGLRSYASSASSPSAGADVYDVYSRRDGVGLNGVPYREW